MPHRLASRAVGRTLRTLLWPLLLTNFGSAVADQTPEQPPYTQLVRQLGCGQYSERESAAKQLVDVGLAAKPALMRGMRDSDLEVRLEAQRIMIRILQDDFDARVTAFLNNTQADTSPQLPGWESFGTLVGSDFSARQLFAEMTRSEAELLGGLDRDGKSIEKQCLDRIQSLTSSSMTANHRRQPIPVASIATLLFIASQLQKDRNNSPTAQATYSAMASRMFTMLSFPDTQQTIRQQAHAKLLQKLLTDWIERTVQSKSQYNQAYAMQLILKYDLQGPGPSLAGQVLQTRDASSNGLAYAAIVLGRFGTAADAPHLLPHLKDSRVFQTWSNLRLKKEPITIQVRDVVLAMLIRIHGQAPRNMGSTCWMRTPKRSIAYGRSDFWKIRSATKRLPSGRVGPRHTCHRPMLLQVVWRRAQAASR